MLAFVLGFLTCWFCGGLWTAYLCNVHDRATGHTTLPSFEEVLSTIFLWPWLWYIVANEDIDDFWGDEVSDEWKGL